MKTYLFLFFLLTILTQPLDAQVFPSQQYLVTDGEELYYLGSRLGLHCSDFTCDERDGFEADAIPREILQMAVDPNGIRSYMRQSGEILRCTSIECPTVEHGNLSVLDITQFWDSSDPLFEPRFVVFAVDNDGFPVLVFPYQDQLHFIHCIDPLCEGTPYDTVLPPLFRLKELRLQFTANNLPLLAIITGRVDEPNTLLYLQCFDTNCEENSSYVPLISGVISIIPPAIVIAQNGDMIVAYADPESGQTSFGRCHGLCQNYDSQIQPLVAATTLLGLSVDSKGFPVLALMDNISEREYGIYFMFCNDEDCSGNDERLILYNIEDVHEQNSFTSQLIISPMGIPALLMELIFDTLFLTCDRPYCEEYESIPQSDLGIVSQITAPLIQSLQNDGIVLEVEFLYSEDNLPILAYYETFETGIKQTVLLYCENSLCVEPHRNERIIAESAGSRNSLSLALDRASNPVILYQDSVEGNLYLARCLDRFCDTDPQISLVAESYIFDIPASAFNETYLNSCQAIPDTRNQCQMGVGGNTSLVLDANDNPVITYTNNIDKYGHFLRLLHCDDPFCVNDIQNFVTLVDNLVEREGLIHTPQMRLDTLGYPIIGVTIGRDVNLIHCNDANCLGGDEARTIVDYPEVRSASLGFALAPSDNLPIFAYYASLLTLTYCGDSDCTNIRSTTTHEFRASFDHSVRDILVDTEGNIFVNIANNFVIRCNESACSEYLNFFYMFPSDLEMRMDDTGNLSVLLGSSVDNYHVLLYRCQGEICEIPNP